MGQCTDSPFRVFVSSYLHTMPTTLLRRLRSSSNSTKSHASKSPEVALYLTNSSKSPSTTPSLLPASASPDRIRSLPTKIGYAELDHQDSSRDSKSNTSDSFEAYSRAEREKGKGVRLEWIDVTPSSSSREREKSTGRSQPTSSQNFEDLPRSLSSPLPLDTSSRQAIHPRRRSHHSRSRSRSKSRSRSRSRQGSSPSLPSSLPAPTPSYFPWTRRHSLPSSLTSSSSLSTSSFSSFGTSIKTCVDPRGRRILARRDSDFSQNSPPPRHARHRSGVYGIGDESEWDVEEKVVESVEGNEKGQRLQYPLPMRPPLRPLVIPHSSPSRSEPSVQHSSPRLATSGSPRSTRRREPQPIPVFTPPPPLVVVPQSAFSTFSSHVTSGSKDLSRRRSGVLRRSSTQSPNGNKLSRSTSIYVPKMQASLPRGDLPSPLPFDGEPNSPGSSFPLTPPRSPTLSVESSSSAYSTSPLLATSQSLVIASPEPFENYSIGSPPRRTSLISFDLPISPLTTPQLEEPSEIVSSKNLEQARSLRTSPPVTLRCRYRQPHQRSYSEGYPSNSHAMKIPTTVMESQVRQTSFARLNLKVRQSSG